MPREEGRESGEEQARELVRQLLILDGEKGRLPAMRERAAGARVDWDLFLQLAGREHVAPLLFQQVRERKIVPAGVEAGLQGSYLANAKRNMLLLHELRGALEALSSAGIEAIVLKGAALAETAYGNIALRMMRDLDLLVRDREAQTAVRVLQGMGYGRQRAEPRAGTGLAYENEIGLRKEGPLPFFLEVHWSLFDSPFYQQLPFDWAWETAEVVQTASGAMRVLSPEAQVLYYAGHIQLHHAHEAQMLWLYDLKQILQMHEETMDWELILRLAEENYLVLALQKTLGVLAEEWAAPAPEEALERLRGMEASRAEAEVFAALTAKERPVAQRFWTDLKLMRGRRERMHYAWVNLFPSPAYMYERYGFESAWRLPFYYVYRFYVGLRRGKGARG